MTNQEIAYKIIKYSKQNGFSLKDISKLKTSNPLSYLFVWNNTLEGYVFWKGIFNLLNENKQSLIDYLYKYLFKQPFIDLTVII